MSQQKQQKIKYIQKVKRKKNRAQLKKRGFNPDDIYVSGLCLGMPKK